MEQLAACFRNWSEVVAPRHLRSKEHKRGERPWEKIGRNE